MAMHNVFSHIGLILCLAVLGVAQQKEIRHVPVKPISPASGPEMYKAYCAVCHGMTGKGNGPAAEALKVPPSDLTTLAKKKWRKVPVRSCQERYPGGPAPSGTRIEGYASLG